MNYTSRINKLLQPKSSLDFTVLDLFAGCGGLALGFESSGFHTLGNEAEMKASETYNHNLKGTCITEKLTAQTEYKETFDVVIGGPPCQPFSVGGHQKGIDDEGNGFPAFVSAIQQIKPKIWLFENVRGMLYGNKWYLDEIIETLRKENYSI